MGFGHRVYKVRDPRADVLAAAAERLFTRAGDMALYTLARAVEATALRLLEEYKPGRRLQTNVEFYTALLLHGLGFDVTLFTPTFAISRVAAGLRTRSSSSARTGSSVRSRSTWDHEAGSGYPLRHSLPGRCVMRASHERRQTIEVAIRPGDRYSVLRASTGSIGSA